MLQIVRRAAVSVLLLPIVAGFGPAGLAAKEWTLQDGRSLRGDCTGAVGGQVVIKTAARREYVPLGMFSLADRDEVCAFLVAKNLKPQIVELMAFENRKAAPVPRTTSTSASSPDYVGLDVTISPGKPEPGTYDLPVPSRDLVEPAALRDWTDITGDRLSASFEKVVPPAHVRLRGADGTVHRFALVNFVQADFAAMRAILAADADKPVFPDMPPTSTAGRRWRDRRGRSLQAEFARLSGNDVVLKFGTEERSFPIAGLSADDVEWIRSELQSRMAPPPPPPSSSGSGSTGPFGHRYEYRCNICAHTWTGMSLFSRCPQCEAKRRQDQPAPPPQSPFQTFPSSPSPSPQPPPIASPRPSTFPAPNAPRLDLVQELSCTKCKHRWKAPLGERPENCPSCNTRFANAIGGTSSPSPVRSPSSSGGGSGSGAAFGVIGVVAVLGTVGLIVVGGLGAVVYFAATSGSKTAKSQTGSRRRRRDDDEYDDDDWD